MLRWSGTAFEPYDLGPTPNTIDGTVDVDYDLGPNVGDFLVWEDPAFRPRPVNNEIALSLDDVGDVNAPSPSFLELLQWNGSEWVNATVTTNTPELAALTDTDTSGASNGDLLKYDGALWSTGSYELEMELGDVGNVDTTGAAVKETLTWNGTSWVPVDIVGDIALDDLDDVDTTGKASNQLLYWNESAGQWNAQALGGVNITTLPGLGDVNTAVVSEGEALVWNGTEWRNGPSTTGVGDGGDLDSGIAVAPYAFNVYGGGDFEAGTDDLPVVETIDGGDFD